MRRLAALLAALAVTAPSIIRADPVTIHDGPSPPATAWRAAVETGDLAALAHMHGPRTIAFPPDQEKMEGAPAIMAGYTDLFAHNTVQVTFVEAHWIETPPVIVSWGLTTLTLHPKDGGRVVVSQTRFTDAAVMVDGNWRYLVDHASRPAR